MKMWYEEVLTEKAVHIRISGIYTSFHSRTLHLDIIRVFYLPTDAQENWFKKKTKISIKTAPICFSLITIIRERIIQAF